VTRKPQRPKAKDLRPGSGFAKKSLGQNFLVDNNYIEKIITALSLSEKDTVIEIGPGRGALTERLVEKAGKAVAVEIDNYLVPFLEDKFSQNNNFSVVHEDALEIDFRGLLNSSVENGEQLKVNSVKLVANLPYYISTAILQRLIEQRECFSQMILMLQREVVERITAEPGNSERGFLTVLAEAYMTAQKLFDVPPEAFRPAPKVWSAVVRLEPKEVDIGDEKLFRALISAGFAYKRKTILNNFKNAPPKLKERTGDVEKFLETSGIDPRRRAETLTFAEWKRLNDVLG
jgi:16S rRNA (adenine1518-N6/adenine1519-N6)-dimethyltransferase